MAVTAQTVVDSAFKKSGVKGIGQMLSNTDNLDALADLGDMLARWNAKRWLVWNLIDVAFLSNGAQSYTVGPGGNFNVSPRPDRIAAAYFTQHINGGTPISYPLTQIMAREQYSRIAMKQLVSWPQAFYYEPSFPLGRLWLYPVGQANLFELHLLMKEVWPVDILSATSLANYPPLAWGAMKFSLARILRQAYGKGLRPDPMLDAMASDALETMRSSQAALPELVTPSALRTGSRYNIYSDQPG
jgi:hypothetical protein